MSSYSRLYNFTAKDALTSGDPNKRVLGSEVDAELNAAQTAINSKADDSLVVHLAGTESITGAKTFSAASTFAATLSMSGAALNYAAAADVASATTTDIGAAASNNVRITGTTTITGLGTATAGITRKVRFAAALTLTHNATSLILPGSANITTAANDTAEFLSLGSGNWICLFYKRASGYPPVDISVAKAVVKFNGTGTPAVDGVSHNISSITDNGTGDYTVNFTTAFQSGSTLAPVGLCRRVSTNSDMLLRIKQGGTYSASAIQFVTQSAGLTAEDPDIVTVVVFGTH